MTAKNFWGQLPEVREIVSPASILNEQASMLTEHTKGVVVGSVRSVQPRKPGNVVAAELIAYVPALNKYSLRIIHVEHAILSYPCNCMSNYIEPVRGFVEVADQSEFESILKAVLTNEKLLEFISNLISQVRAINS